MNTLGSDKKFKTGARSVVLTQICIGGFTSAGFLLKSGVPSAQAAIFGAFIGVVLSLFLSWSVARAANAAPEKQRISMGMLYLSAAQRFLLALVLFSVGLGYLKLEPLPMVVTFGLVQIGYVVLIRMQSKSNKILG
ncbi:MAG: ATP synthase subunit I [Gammaproteobacteria bacterium]|nr:ATP synthase subunit I [Gammaproteobacteria bacterium]